MGAYLGPFALALAAGFVSAVIAKSKGRDAAVWFLVGIVFNIFALAAIVFTKNLKAKKG